MSTLYSNSIFWIDTDKIKPNPFQPRRDFDEVRLQDLADSIKQYGVLQPLTISRVEIEKEEGGLVTEYELIAGERRLRAAKLAGVSQVPAIIRVGDTSMMKLELAIIENLQREDLNSVDRARAFFQLANEFKFTHAEIAKKMGKSREYVSNTLRILALPEEILDALSAGKISEGHTRPLLMLTDHPEEQIVLFKEVLYKKITVREAEKLARKIAYDRVRKKELMPDPEITELEEEFQEKLGTRVHIDRKELGGQIKIDFFSTDDLRSILELIKKAESEKRPEEMLDNYITKSQMQEKEQERSQMIDKEQVQSTEEKKVVGFISEVNNEIPKENIVTEILIEKNIQENDNENTADENIITTTEEQINPDTNNISDTKNKTEREKTNSENFNDPSLYDISNFSI